MIAKKNVKIFVGYRCENMVMTISCAMKAGDETVHCGTVHCSTIHFSGCDAGHCMLTVQFVFLKSETSEGLRVYHENSK